MQRFKTNWMYIPVVIQSLSCVQLFVILWIATPQAPLSSTVPWSWLRCMSIESVMLSNYRFCCCCFSFYLQSFPASRSFPESQLFASGGHSIGASASSSVLSVNVQCWFPLGLIGWISLQSKGLSRVFSSTTIQKHQFFSTQSSLRSNSQIHTWLLGKP